MTQIPVYTKAQADAAVAAAVAALVSGAPGALDTLKELADALGDDASYAATITTALGSKQAASALLTAIAGVASGAGKIPYFTGALAADVLGLDPDSTFAANSDTNVPTQKAVNTALANAGGGITVFDMLRL